MKILLVTDQFFAANNGTTISSRRFAQVLRQHGHQVRVAAAGTEAMAREDPLGEDAYLFQELTVPGFGGLIHAQGMVFAKPDDALLERAVAWADVVHFLMPFALSHHGIAIARRLGTPYTAAFHVQPENITSSIHLGKCGGINTLIYRWFHHYIYRWCGHVHCPSRFIAGELEKHGYRAQLYVISNGVDPDFSPAVHPPREWNPVKEKGRFTVLMIGRFSVEKRQDVLLRAVARSRYREKIELVLAGKGPREKALRSLAEKLGVPVTMRFFSKEELIGQIARSDLYVHAADVEIEAMSCMEAFACGLVPVIADSVKSATPQFALDDRSLFEAGNDRELSERIDYWIEHPKERCEMEARYGELGRNYSLDACVRRAEEMFHQAITDCAPEPSARQEEQAWNPER